MDDLHWAVREYCNQLHKIESGTGNEFERVRLHDEIASLLKVDRDMISGVLHNIEIRGRDGYLWYQTAEKLLEMKHNGHFTI